MTEGSNVQSQFNDVIGTPPKWILYGGLSAIVLVWLMLIVIIIGVDKSEFATAGISIIPDDHLALIKCPYDSAYIENAWIGNGKTINEGASLLTIRKGASPHTLKSPKAGVVNFLHYITPGTALNKGDTIAYIVKADKNIYGYSMIDVEKGKSIAIGDLVNISINGCPPSDYGFFKGVVNEILLLDNGRTYGVQIRIESISKTSFNKSIPLRAVYNGKAYFLFKRKFFLSI
jgi:hypothetical protein